jgi:hypothetical protein
LVDGVERREEFAFTPAVTPASAEKQVQTETESQPETRATAEKLVQTETGATAAPESPVTTLRRLQAPAEQSGQAEKNVARLLHDLGLADYVLAGEDFYAKVENKPYLDLVLEGHAGGNGLLIGVLPAELRERTRFTAVEVDEPEVMGGLTRSQAAFENHANPG